jgi:phosphoserine phosphatase
VQSVTNRVLVVLDIDSTLINEEGLDLLAERAGGEVAAEISAITDRAMAGELDFAESLVKRVSLLEGQPVSLFDDVAQRLTLTEGATALIDAIHQAGGIIGAVSGGFHELVDPLASRIGIDHWLANRFEVADGVLTGRVVGDIVDAQAKATFLTHWADYYNIPHAHTIAVGDGANDVAMFAAAGVSVAFCGKPVANAQATVCVEQRDLTRVLDYVPAGA